MAVVPEYYRGRTEEELRTRTARMVFWLGVAAVACEAVGIWLELLSETTQLLLIGAGWFLGLAVGIIGLNAERHRRINGQARVGCVLGLVAVLTPLVTFCVLMAISGHEEAEYHRKIATESHMLAIKDALSEFKKEKGRFPTTAEGLHALDPWLPKSTAYYVAKYAPWQESLMDAWGHPLIYRFPGKSDPTWFDLIAPGPDGKEDTSDDIDDKDFVRF